MRFIRWWGLLLVAAIVAGCASRLSTTELPKGTVLAPGIKLPNDTAVAVYLPSSDRQGRFFIGNAWVLPGRSLEDAVTASTRHFFPSSFLAETTTTTPYGLLLSIQPEWKLEAGEIRMTMKYRVHAADGASLLEGSQTATAALGELSTSNGFYNAALRSSQLVLVEVLNRLKPDATRHPASARFTAADPKLYVDYEKPISTGTGFFVNTSGQLVTAAHVLQNCALVEVKRDNKPYATRLIKSSPLLDLAVLSTDIHEAHALPLRADRQLKLGEPVANVGFPLQPILAANPMLTRGNVSSRSALAGSLGQFQFSASIQPGSSGGPVVSDGGELLGVTLGTLNAAALIERGVLPQNVNFALDARYVGMFLQQARVPFVETASSAQNNMQTGNEAALSAVVSVACYQ